MTDVNVGLWESCFPRASVLERFVDPTSALPFLLPLNNTFRLVMLPARRQTLYDYDGQRLIPTGHHDELRDGLRCDLLQKHHPRCAASSLGGKRLARLSPRKHFRFRASTRLAGDGNTWTYLFWSTPMRRAMVCYRRAMNLVCDAPLQHSENANCARRQMLSFLLQECVGWWLKAVSNQFWGSSSGTT